MFFHVPNKATLFWYRHAEDGQATGWNMLAKILWIKNTCWLFMCITNAYMKFSFQIMKFAVFITTVHCAPK